MLKISVTDLFISFAYFRLMNLRKLGPWLQNQLALDYKHYSRM